MFLLKSYKIESRNVAFPLTYAYFSLLYRAKFEFLQYSSYLCNVFFPPKICMKFVPATLFALPFGVAKLRTTALMRVYINKE